MVETILARLAAGAPVPERVAIVAAHPDDEVVGMGARLGQLPRLRLIHLTDGAPRDGADAARAGFPHWRDYAEARARELDRALFVTGAGGAERRGYGLPDGEAVAHLDTVVPRLAEDLADVDAVFTHPYEHGHPDHDSAALAVARACSVLGERAPVHFEFASYHLAPEGPRFGRFWPDGESPETIILLGDEERARKAKALACFESQAGVLAQFPREVERLRPAPPYQFHQPAPPGAALFEQWGFATTAAQWRQAATALASHPE